MLIECGKCNNEMKFDNDCNLICTACGYKLSPGDNFPRVRQYRTIKCNKCQFNIKLYSHPDEVVCANCGHILYKSMCTTIGFPSLDKMKKYIFEKNIPIVRPPIQEIKDIRKQTGISYTIIKYALIIAKFENVSVMTILRNFVSSNSIKYK